MGKAKRKHIAKLKSQEKGAQIASFPFQEGTSLSREPTSMNDDDDDDNEEEEWRVDPFAPINDNPWVEVRKRRIIITIPTLPSAEKPPLVIAEQESFARDNPTHHSQEAIQYYRKDKTINPTPRAGPETLAIGKRFGITFSRNPLKKRSWMKASLKALHPPLQGESQEGIEGTPSKKDLCDGFGIVSSWAYPKKGSSPKEGGSIILDDIDSVLPCELEKVKEDRVEKDIWSKDSVNSLEMGEKKVCSKGTESVTEDKETKKAGCEEEEEKERIKWCNFYGRRGVAIMGKCNFKKAGSEEEEEEEEKGGEEESIKQCNTDGRRGVTVMGKCNFKKASSEEEEEEKGGEEERIKWCNLDGRRGVAAVGKCNFKKASNEEEEEVVRIKQCNLNRRRGVAVMGKCSLEKAISEEEEEEEPIKRCNFDERGVAVMGQCSFNCFGCFRPSLLTVNGAIRAHNLKKQLEKAGGLSNWLISIGLDQFVEIFERHSFSELQLLQLTMNDLKGMGAFAVGPRRKLIHSLNHLCQKLISL